MLISQGQLQGSHLSLRGNIEAIRLSGLVLPTQYSFDRILNDTPFVNSFLLFIPTLAFELKIINHNCAPNIYWDNLIISISTCNRNTSLSFNLYSLPQASWTFTFQLRQLKQLQENLFQEEFSTSIVKILHQQHHKMSRHSGSFI